MPIAKITIEYFDDEGNPITDSGTVEYDQDKSGVVAEIEYYSSANGGPIMRPKKPRD